MREESIEGRIFKIGDHAIGGKPYMIGDEVGGRGLIYKNSEGTDG